MLIKSVIKRAGGTKITLDNTAYHFKERDDSGDHIDDVTVEAHIARLLSIKGGYVIHSVTGDVPKVPTEIEPLIAAASEDPTATTEDDEDELVSDEEQAVYDILDGVAKDKATVVTAYTFLKGEAPDEKATIKSMLPEITKMAIEGGFTGEDDEE